MRVWGIIIAALAGCTTELGVELDTNSADETRFTEYSTTDSSAANSGAARFTGLEWSAVESVPGLIRAHWRQQSPETVIVEYTVNGGPWVASPPISGVPGTNEQFVVGVPMSVRPDDAANLPSDGSLSTAVRWRVRSVDDDFVEEGPVYVPEWAPEGLPVPTVVEETREQWSDGRYLLTTINGDGGWTTGQFWVVIYDRQGRPVWAKAVPNRRWSLFAQVSATGDYLLWDQSTAWSEGDAGSGSTIQREYLDRPLSGDLAFAPALGLHHAFVEHADGTLAWGSVHPSHSDSEALVELSANGGPERVIWTCVGDWLGAPTDNCRSSGLFYDRRRDTYLMAFRTLNSVAEVREAQTLWWSGGVGGGLIVSPHDAQIRLPHGVSWTADDTLLVATESDSGPLSTWVREFDIDEAGGRLTQVWSHDAGVYAAANGDASRQGDHTLQLLGTAGEVQEIDARGHVVWHLDFGGTYLLGRGQWIDDLYPLLAPTTLNSGR